MPRGVRTPREGELKFEPWLGKGLTRPGMVPRMTISSHGEVRVNRPAADMLGAPRYVRIMLDRRARAVGLMATEATDPAGYAFRVDGAKGHGRAVGARVALAAAGLQPRETIAYEPQLAGNVLYIIVPAGQVA